MLTLNRSHTKLLSVPKEVSRNTVNSLSLKVQFWLLLAFKCEFTYLCWLEHESGGHFPALDSSVEFVEDLREFFGNNFN